MRGASDHHSGFDRDQQRADAGVLVGLVVLSGHPQLTESVETNNTMPAIGRDEGH